MAVLAARCESGAGFVHGLTNFHDRLAGADLLITGEGRLDHQSLGGKAAVGTAKAAISAGIPVVAVCKHSLTEEELQDAGFRKSYSLLDLEPDLETCLRTSLRPAGDHGPDRRRRAARGVSRNSRKIVAPTVCSALLLRGSSARCGYVRERHVAVEDRILSWGWIRAS